MLNWNYGIDVDENDVVDAILADLLDEWNVKSSHVILFIGDYYLPNVWWYWGWLLLDLLHEKATANLRFAQSCHVYYCFDVLI